MPALEDAKDEPPAVTLETKPPPKKRSSAADDTAAFLDMYSKRDADKKARKGAGKGADAAAGAPIAPMKPRVKRTAAVKAKAMKAAKAKAMKAKAMKPMKAAKDAASAAGRKKPSFSVERSRSQVQCRANTGEPGANFAIKYGAGTGYTECTAVAKARLWLKRVGR